MCVRARCRSIDSLIQTWQNLSHYIMHHKLHAKETLARILSSHLSLNVPPKAAYKPSDWLQTTFRGTFSDTCELRIRANEAMWNATMTHWKLNCVSVSGWNTTKTPHIHKCRARCWFAFASLCFVSSHVGSHYVSQTYTYNT